MRNVNEHELYGVWPVCAENTHITICMYSQCRPAPGVRTWGAGCETRHWSSCSAGQSSCSSRGNCPTDCKGWPREKNKEISYDEWSGRIDTPTHTHTSTPTHPHPHMHANTNTPTPIGTHAHTHACTHARMQARTETRTVKACGTEFSIFLPFSWCQILYTFPEPASALITQDLLPAAYHSPPLSPLPVCFGFTIRSITTRVFAQEYNSGGSNGLWTVGSDRL